jgi:hypothetical protein
MKWTRTQLKAKAFWALLVLTSLIAAAAANAKWA